MSPTPRSTSNSSVERFRALTQRYYDEMFARFPAAGTEAGLHQYDAELGRADPATWEAQGRLIRETMGAIEDLPHQDFCAGDLLDRRAMLASLRWDYLQDVQLARWRNNPQIHLHGTADAVYTLFVHNADNLAAVAPAILSRLKQTPRYLDEAAEGLAKPDPLWKELTVRAAPSVAEFFTSLAAPLAQVTGQLLATLRRLTKKAADAALAYGAHIKTLRAAPAGSFAIGEVRFTLLMRDRLGVDYSPREAVALARRMAEDLKEEMRREAKQFNAKKSADEILAEAAAQWQPEGKNLLDAYEKTMRRTRERFAEAGWISYPKGDRLLVRAVPDFMSDQFPTAAYSSPGALDPDQTGIFWVNDLSTRTMSDEQRRAEVAQHFGLELTCAHEAYPGHHLQYINQNRHPSLARKLAHHAIYYEGWTLWCEQMLADLGVPENPYLKLTQLHDALWRAWRIVIDVGLQTGTLSYQEAVDTLVREVGFTAGRAHGDVNWYTSMPTVPMSYLLGKMELLRLKQARVDQGGMSLQEFNNWVLSFGAIPWRWIEESGL